MEKSAEFLTRDQILIATEETLRRYGVAKTSVTDVAKALNVSHGTLYRHFKSKAELLEGATAKWLDEKIIRPLKDVCHDPSLEGALHLKTYLQTLIGLKQHYAREDEELFTMYAKVTEESAELIDQHVGHLIEQMSEILIRGAIQADNPARLARTIFYATSRFHHPAHAYEWKHANMEQEFADVWTLIEKGFL
ncbi:TetR/AcrR family transcriptional regulator [Paenibacillus eucommiae]|uniref:AcrR family transcriptional regulator n=1 Tax=Paenibacillus eucommiae TaxID=1355755 RepID=A0ABS4J5M6_9BACL|nr:TetR family transcriptional regulator [Paenibacillus eucommiae]MBP1995133.1 AcrR family transcriptional regulator [Paenibacillus eucommiae]